MPAPDVNVLVYAYRIDLPQHGLNRRWLEALLASGLPFGLSELVLSGFLRVATNARLFRAFPGREPALAFADALLHQPGCVRLRPGERHWQIFRDFLALPGVAGPVVADAYHAALAVEHDCDWVTNDADFARFPGLRWIRPSA